MHGCNVNHIVAFQALQRSLTILRFLRFPSHRPLEVSYSWFRHARLIFHDTNKLIILFYVSSIYPHLLFASYFHLFCYVLEMGVSCCLPRVRTSPSLLTYPIGRLLLVCIWVQLADAPCCLILQYLIYQLARHPQDHKRPLGGHHGGRQDPASIHTNDNVRRHHAGTGNFRTASPISPLGNQPHLRQCSLVYC